MNTDVVFTCHKLQLLTDCGQFNINQCKTMSGDYMIFLYGSTSEITINNGKSKLLGS